MNDSISPMGNFENYNIDVFVLRKEAGADGCVIRLFIPNEASDEKIRRKKKQGFRV